jgi:hypothetical protein
MPEAAGADPSWSRLASPRCPRTHGKTDGGHATRLRRRKQSCALLRCCSKGHCSQGSGAWPEGSSRHPGEPSGRQAAVPGMLTTGAG